MPAGSCELKKPRGFTLSKGTTFIVTVESWKSMGSVLSVARTLNVYKPGRLGAPAIAQQFGPQISCTFIPGGGLPAITDQLYVVLPFVELKAKRKSKVKRPIEVSRSELMKMPVPRTVKTPKE